MVAGEPARQIPHVQGDVVDDAADPHLLVRGQVARVPFTRIVERVGPVVRGEEGRAVGAGDSVGAAVVAQPLEANDGGRRRVGAGALPPSWFGAAKPRLRISTVTSVQTPAAFCRSILMKPPIRLVSSGASAWVEMTRCRSSARSYAQDAAVVNRSGATDVRSPRTSSASRHVVGPVVDPGEVVRERHRAVVGTGHAARSRRPCAGSRSSSPSHRDRPRHRGGDLVPALPRRHRCSR